MTEEKKTASGIMFLIIGAVLSALIAVSFVLLFLIPEYRHVFIDAVLILGVFFNLLFGVRDLTEGKKRGFLFLAWTALLALILLNTFLQIIRF